MYRKVNLIVPIFTYGETEAQVGWNSLLVQEYRDLVTVVPQTSGIIPEPMRNWSTERLAK